MYDNNFGSGQMVANSVKKAELEDTFSIKQANGWVQVGGSTNLTFTAGGIGQLALEPSPHGLSDNFSRENRRELKRVTIPAGPTGDSITFMPYWNTQYILAASNRSNPFHGGEPYFDGQLSAQMQSEFGNYQVNFPPNPEDFSGSKNMERRSNSISVPAVANKVYNTVGVADILIVSRLMFGIDIGMEINHGRVTTPDSLVDVRILHPPSMEALLT
jgi:hypothetical protein